MSLDKTDVIDFLTRSEDGSTVTLYLVATEPWRTHEQTLSLQAKLKHYVAFATDGQLDREYPSVAGLHRAIDVRYTHPLPDAEQRVVEFAREYWCAPSKSRC